MVNKFTKGKILSYCGSSEYIGAGILTTKSAMITGAGIIKRIIPESIYQKATNLDEIIDVIINDDGFGFLTIKNYLDIEILN